MKLEEQLVLKLYNPELRESALVELSKKREMFPDLAPLMWHSFGTMFVLLQSVASHPETRIPFLKAEFTEYLYPFLNTTSNARSFEYLRLTALGVFGALVKVDDTEVVNTLLDGHIIPLCLRIMETGSELSKTVATFIVQKIILDEAGLQYICATPERFFGIAIVLARMVAEQPSTRLLKHIVRCYLRLTDDPRAHIALQTHLPEALRDGTFDNGLRDDAVARHYRQQLLDNLAVPAGGAPPAVPGSAAAGVTQPVPAPAAGGAPHPGPGSVAGASPEGSSQEGLSHAHPGPAPSAGAAPHPGPGPVVGGSPGGSSPSSAHPGPAPTEVGAPHPAPGPVAGGRPGGSSQAGPRRRRR
ncbi:CCR4-NOT transcription complex subunit 9-like isoform X3 [Panicum virgatum]|uniref:CCR4-NOT transcription complex subunit 9-like isoform X3 n=2 Tax=Panicum virgatum TaxID=38727 RepID=UPI0019D5C672|nr:CCR4-NOT transcription complex subunit 9-like isoform X3 [Panicum virgatum]